MLDISGNVILAFAGIIALIVGSFIVNQIPIVFFIILSFFYFSVFNTEAIENLIRQLGTEDKETLMHGLYSQYESIRESIGRGEKASLTEQHIHLEKWRQIWKK